jgi:hypothetical protein
MIPPPDSDLVRYEEQKREAHWDPAQRWLVIQEMIAWADAQATGGRNTRARCLELQHAKDLMHNGPAAQSGHISS